MKKAVIFATGLEQCGKFNPLHKVNKTTWIEDIIDNLIDKEYKMIYIIIDRERYELIRLLASKKYEDTIIITKELYGEDTGGDLISLSPFITHRDRILAIYENIRLDENLFNLTDLLYPEFRYNIVISHRKEKVKQTVNLIYLDVRKNKLVAKFTRRRIHDFYFSGLMLLRGSFFKWLEKRLFKRPELPNIDITDVLNDYISSGGKIYSYEYFSILFQLEKKDEKEFRKTV